MLSTAQLCKERAKYLNPAKVRANGDRENFIAPNFRQRGQHLDSWPPAQHTRNDNDLPSATVLERN